jgi:PIN domain nuclease of toxin-antitoxin system
LRLVVEARSLAVLPITPEIAPLSVSLGLHGDPADRIIASSTVLHGAILVTSDHRLLESSRIPTIW